MTRVLKARKNFLDNGIKKYDYEIVPTYYVMKYLNTRQETSSVKFFPEGIEHDALLQLNDNGDLHIELTRAIEDGQQEHYQRQLLRRNGSCFTNIPITLNKATNEYIQTPPLAKECEQEQDRYVLQLLAALKRKQVKQNEKKKSEKKLYDWLIITINIGLFQEHFYEICAEFGNCIKNNSIDFKRIFVVLENQNPLLGTNYLWDSWYDKK